MTFWSTYRVFDFLQELETVLNEHWMFNHSALRLSEYLIGAARVGSIKAENKGATWAQ